MNTFTDGTMTGNTLSMVDMEKRLEALPTTDKVNALIKQAITDLLNSGDVAVNGTQFKVVADNKISNDSTWNNFTYTAKESGWYSMYCSGPKSGTGSAFIRINDTRAKESRVNAFSGTFKDGYPVNKNTGLVDKEWHLCDGTNGTPDLRNRFIYGGDGTNEGSTGGNKTVTLTNDNLPQRTVVSLNKKRTGGEWESVPWNSQTYPEYGATCLFDMYIGGGNVKFEQPISVLPPYYVLAFIMKL